MIYGKNRTATTLFFSLLFILTVGCGSGGQEATSPDQTSGGSSASTAAKPRMAETDRTASPDSSRNEQGELAVKEADLRVNTGQIDTSARRIRSLAERAGGYVESSRRTDQSSAVRTDLTLRVPDTRFDTLLQRIRERMNVTSFRIRNYRISIKQVRDVLDVLNEAIQDLQSVRQQINRMSVSKEKIDLMMRLTRRRSQLARQRKQQLRERAQSLRRSSFSTVHVTLLQEIQPGLWPDDVWDQFRQELRGALHRVSRIVIHTLTGGLTLLFRTIQGVVYLAVVGAVLWVVFLVGRRGYRWIRSGDAEAGA